MLGVYTAYAGLLSVAAIAFLRVGFKAPAGPGRTLGAFAPVMFVVVASIAQLYAFLFQQSAAGFGEHARLKREARKRGEKAPALAEVKYSGRYGAVLAADRTVGNYTEQLAPFLVSVIGYALFVSANRAATLGWLWIVFRAYYPLVYAQPFPALLSSTIPAYCCVWWMLGMATYAAASLAMEA